MVVDNFAPKFGRLTFVRDRLATRHYFLIWSLILLLFPGLVGGTAAASVSVQNPPVTSHGPGLPFAIADFDGDNRPDLATVEAGQINSLDTRYWIGFRLSGGMQQTLGLTAPNGGLQLTSRDVNGDNFLDVIVTTTWANWPVAVLLNDGHGNFIQFDPSAFPSLMQYSEINWTSASDEIKDAAAALPSRSPSGECEPAGDSASPRLETALLLPKASQNSPFFTVVSFQGRAPPAFVP